MRLFYLINLEHVALYFFPTLLFILVFAMALAYFPLRGPDDDPRIHKVVHRYPEGIEDRNAPFPLAMTLIIAGAVIWVLGYILGVGLLGIRI
jgi:hypothetical protein